jgi:PAS domain S-box-containing protein
MQRNILIIDDTQSMLLLLKFMLETTGEFQVFTAASGKDGLRLIEQIKPDLILLDIAMPGFSGFDVCKNLSENKETKDIPIIFLSAFTDTFQKIKAFELGGVDYITKPFNGEELIARINIQLKIANLNKQLRKSNEHLEERVKQRTTALENEIAYRKETDEKLLQNRNMLEQIADNSSAFIALLNTKLEYIFINKEYEVFFRLQKEKLIGKKINQILSEEYLSKAMPFLKKALQGEKTKFSYFVLNSLNERKEVNTIYTPYIQNNEVTGIIVLAIDITEIKKTEALLIKTQNELKEINNQLENKIIERTKELVLKNDELYQSKNLLKYFVNHSVSWENFCDKQGNPLYCTPAFEKITGYKMEQYLQGIIKIKDFVLDADKEKYIQYSKKAIKGDNFENLEFRILTANKQTKYLSKSVFQVYNQKNERIGFRAGLIDISKQKEEEAARIAAENKIFNAIIESEEKERAHFAKELHDGIGPILSTIKMFAEWLKRPDLKTPKDEIYKKMEYSIEEAVSTVKEISNNLSPHILANFGLVFALKSFIEKTQALNSPVIHFITNIKQRFSNEIEITIYRALLECINNSIKHAQAKNISISLQLTSDKIEAKFSDDGIGFDYDYVIQQQKGLGLFNIQNRIHTLGGNFKIQSVIHQGVNIWFELYI